MANKENQCLLKAEGNSRKRQRGSAYQTDEDLVFGCDASLDLLEIKAKLDKILTVVGEVESIKLRLTELEDENCLFTIRHINAYKW